MLKAMIVDDEAPARSELAYLLGEVGGVEVVVEAAGVREAIEKLKEYPVDVIFLDINMPEATGLQFAEALKHLKFPPAVVFVTAYSEHAIDAFQVVKARDDYAYLQTDGDRYFSTVSLAQLEKRLDGHGFFRVHRAYLVNLSMIEEVESIKGGTLSLTLNGVDEKIPVSRRRVSSLKKALGL